MKPVGGRILTIDYVRYQNKDKENYKRSIDSMKFPL